MRKVPTFADPFGSLGRPTLLGFCCWLKVS